MKTTLYKRHSKNIGTWTVETGSHPTEPDTSVLTITHVKNMDGGKEVVSYVNVSPKNIGKSNETTPIEQAELEAESRVKKQLDKGYVRSIDEVGSENLNTLGFPMPMTAHPIEKVKDIDWVLAVAQPKLDGHRAMFKDGVIYSRQGKVINLPHIVEAINSLGLQDKHLDGEIYLHGKTLQQISSLIKRPREESLDLVYHVYDVVDVNHYTYRYNDAFGGLDIKEDCSLQLVPWQWVEDSDDMMEVHQKHLEDGYEGTMLRHGGNGYQAGRRSSSLLKVKEFHDDEFRIVGYLEGTPRFTNGSFLSQGIWQLETKDGMGFTATMQGTMHDKNRLLKEAETHIGKMLTVKYHYYSADGVPQLPVAIRFREDI